MSQENISCFTGGTFILDFRLKWDKVIGWFGHEASFKTLHKCKTEVEKKEQRPELSSRVTLKVLKMGRVWMFELQGIF